MSQKSSLKSPAKRVTFKVDASVPSLSDVTERLEAAMRDANEIIKLETDSQQLMRDIKGLYTQYHAQCLTRYQIEKQFAEKTTHNDSVMEEAIEARRQYLALIAKYIDGDSEAGGNTTIAPAECSSQ